MALENWACVCQSSLSSALRHSRMDSFAANAVCRPTHPPTTDNDAEGRRLNPFPPIHEMAMSSAHAARHAHNSI